MKRVGVMATLVAAIAARAAPPDHVVIVIEENHSFQQVIGNPSAPFMNSLAAGGATFTNMYAITHPSQPNYVQFFSGDNQGVTNNDPPGSIPFTTPNLGAALISAGASFVGYAQGLPAPGSLVVDAYPYARRHVPWTLWQANAPAPNQLPPSMSQPFTAFPADFSQLPSVAIVIPDNLNNMHDGTIAQADAWLSTNFGAYAQWAQTHNSLLIITWDEDESQSRNRIPTIVYGPMVRVGTVDSTWTLHNLLRTVGDWYGAAPSGAAGLAVRPIVGALTSDATNPPMRTRSFQEGVGVYSGGRDTYIESSNPDAAHPAESLVVVDGSPFSQGLIAFDGVIAPTFERVPAGSQILSAKLVILTGSISSDATVNTVRLHRMLAPWPNGATWNSMSGGVTTDDDEAAMTPEFSLLPNTSNTYAIFDVTATVQAWADDAPAHGWMMAPTGSDGWRWVSSEGTPTSDRPRLEVTFIPPHCPGDFNASGDTTVQDLFDFLAAWFARDLASDVNHSGMVTVQDLFDFLTAWFAPCPWGA